MNKEKIIRGSKDKSGRNLNKYTGDQKNVRKIYTDILLQALP